MLTTLSKNIAQALGASKDPSKENHFLTHFDVMQYKNEFNRFMSTDEDLTKSETLYTIDSETFALGDYNFITCALAPNGKIFTYNANKAAVYILNTNDDSLKSIPVASSSGRIFTVATSAVLAPNGKVYFSGLQANSVLVVDTDSEEISFIPILNESSVTTTTYCSNGYLDKNGKIYFLPTLSNYFLVTVDTNSDTASCVNLASKFSLSTNAASYLGAVKAPNGKIYCLPYGAMKVLVIDTDNSDDPLSLLSIALSGNYKWSYGVLHPNGIIYSFPNYTPGSQRNILMVNTNIDEVGFLQIPVSPAGIGNIKLSKNLKIIGAPYASTSNDKCMYIDESNNIYGDLFGDSLGSSLYKYSTSTMGANGMIYCIPLGQTTLGAIGGVLKINPFDLTTDFLSLSSLSLTYGQYKFGASCLAPNGKIYCFPRNASKIFVIDTGYIPKDPSVLTDFERLYVNLPTTTMNIY